MKTISKHRSLIYTILVALLIATYGLSLAANSITVGLIISFYFLDYKENLKNKLQVAFKFKFVWLSILYVVAQAIGLLYSEKYNFGLKQVNHALPFLILPIIALSEKINKHHFIKFKQFVKLWVVALMAFFIIFHLFIVKRTLTTIVDFTINEISSTGQIYPSALIIIALIITIDQLFKKQQLVFNILVFIFLTYCLILLGSRIAILSFVITFIILVLNKYKKTPIYKRIGFLILVFLMFSISIYNVPRINQKVNVFYKTIDFNMDVILTKNSITRTKNTVEHRILIYYTAYKAIINELPLGYGTGDYQDTLNDGYKNIKFKVGIEGKFDTHNQFLQEFLKTGLIGGVIFLLLIAALLNFGSLSNHLVLSAVILTLFGCLFDSFLARQHGAIFVAFIIPFVFYAQKQARLD